LLAAKRRKEGEFEDIVSMVTNYLRNSPRTGYERAGIA
jgi:hypothetical protein